MWLWGGYGFILTSAASARTGLGFGEGGFFWKDLAFELPALWKHEGSD